MLKLISRNSLVFETACDVGCGVGEVLAELQNALDPDIEFSGFDISPQAIAVAKAKENERLKFYEDDFVKSSSKEFDLILLLDVFEHVSDYIGFLESVRDRASWFIFHIPLDITAKGVLFKSNWMLYMRERYGHLHYFSAETAMATLSDAGYEVVDFSYTDDFDVTKKMIPKHFRSRLVYEARRYLSRTRPRLAASIFEQFNLLALARGGRPVAGQRDHSRQSAGDTLG
ncbi:class I SAM-dependent methyltransferase [Mesorhizobium sp. B2-8-9]|uniref:class I SAM-dependent methyltransferase n=1 Tax=Mesorhizobium sp. B2-8-9 TaxID=2589899 RepID=UPI001FEEF5F7|nr:class I SAM-dependent methyltransferase [Mesorhizobium sp. B2-8-9]